MTILQGFQVRLTFGGFLTLLYMVRFVGLLTAALVMAWLSMRANAWEKAAALGVGVLLLPGALCYFDQTWAGYVSVLPFVDGTELLVGFTGDRVLTWLAPAWIALGVGLTIHNRKVWRAKRLITNLRYD